MPFDGEQSRAPEDGTNDATGDRAEGRPGGHDGHNEQEGRRNQSEPNDSQAQHSGDDKQHDGSKDQQGDAAGGDSGRQPAKPRSKKPLLIIAAALVLLLLVWFVIWFIYRNQVSTDDAYTDGNSVSMLPKVSGYIVELRIDDNARVNKGDLLLRIDPRDYLTAQAQARAQLALAEAQLGSARNSLAIAQVQYPAQLRSAEAQHQAAEAALAVARSSYERQHAVDRRATTQENIDTSTNQQQSSLSSLRNAQAQLDIAKLVPEQIQQAASMVSEREAAVEQARSQLAQADLNLSYTEVRAPADGFVTLRNVQLGSYASPGQVMFILVTREVWVTANFKESQLGRMRPGDRVDIRIDAYSDLKLSGHVQSIQYGSGSRFSAFPAENATGNFVKIVQRVPVKIVIDRGLDSDRPLPLGLSVTPTVYFP
jgi:membrane fusion protein, multidrug efflux system